MTSMYMAFCVSSSQSVWIINHCFSIYEINLPVLCSVVQHLRNWERLPLITMFFSNTYSLISGASVTWESGFYFATNGIFGFGLTWEPKCLSSSWDLKVICSLCILSYISFHSIHGIAFKHVGSYYVLVHANMQEKHYVLKSTSYWHRLFTQRRVFRNGVTFIIWFRKEYNCCWKLICDMNKW